MYFFFLICPFFHAALWEREFINQGQITRQSGGGRGEGEEMGIRLMEEEG